MKLNFDYILNEHLPELAKKHLFNSDGTDAYNFTVVDRAAPSQLILSNTWSRDPNVRGDVTVPIFVSKMLEYPRVTFPSLADLHTIRSGTTRERNSRFSLQIEQGTERFIAAGLDSPPSSWELILTHQAGSLDAAVDQARTRNLGIGFGILLLLAVSIGLTLVSAQRERRLAQQQMEFVSAVSHELRTPLAVICSAGENLADGVVHDPEQTREYGALVRNEGRRLTEMVEQVLDFAGIQAGKKTYRFEPVAIRDIIDRALETFEMQIRESGVAVEKRIPMNLPPIMADRPALVRSVQNLVANALKYGQSGNWLSVRAESASNHVNLIVEDHGSGIAAADLPHIFEPFYRASSVVEAQIKGSGLGLSLVKQIVEAHGATITVNSVAKRGTLFKISFPVPDAVTDGVNVKSEDDQQAYSPR
jgi:signal transduction histidine kinase